MLSRTPKTELSLQAVGAQRHRAIGYWLWCVAALLFAMVLVGGATRLTQSGLSIVEWQPVTGIDAAARAMTPGKPNSTNTRQFRNISASIAA